jgi:hypothetical protein
LRPEHGLRNWTFKSAPDDDSASYSFDIFSNKLPSSP